MLNHSLQHIKSSNPLEYPVIDPRYFEEEYGEFSYVIRWQILHSL
jgi:hypothetical protein